MRSNESKRGKKLYYYLSRLDAKELKDFHAYLSSPLLGNSPQMARMLLVIQREVLGTGRKTIDADLFQEEFFPDQALDEGKCKYIRIRLVQMHSKLMDFAAFMEYKSDTNAQHVHLLKAMYKRGWDKHFERVYDEIEAAAPIREFGEYEDYRLRRAIVMNEFQASQNVPNSDLNLGQVNERLDIAFVKSKLKFAALSITTHFQRDSKIDFPFIHETLALATTAPYYDILEIKLFFHLYQLLASFIANDNSTSHQHFDALMELLKPATSLDSFEGSDITHGMISYCNQMTQLGLQGFRAATKELVSLQLEKGLIVQAGLLSKQAYKRVVTTMMRINEIEWTEHFIESWKDKIFGDPERLSYYHNLAVLKFAQKDYDKVIELLYNRIHKYEDESFALGSRIFVCRALWEKGEMDWLRSNLEAFRLFLARNVKISENTRVNHKRFVSYFIRMCDARQAKPDRRAKKLHQILADMAQHGGSERFFWISKAIERELQNTR